MQIPDEVRKCVCFLAYRSAQGVRYAGTGFHVVLGSGEGGSNFGHLVTARHVVVRIEKESTDGIVLIRMNTAEGGFKFVERTLANWVFHPSDSSADVAVLPWSPSPKKYDYRTIPSEMLATPSIVQHRAIGIGDEVFMTGLFASHLGRQRNVPVVRVGNIACMPEEKVDTKFFGPIEAYIIEARSIGGLSGSPVFVAFSGSREFDIGKGKLTRITGPFEFFLLGLVHGHWDTLDEERGGIVDREARINLGMAIVVPVQKVIETMDHPDLVARRDIETQQYVAGKDQG